MVFLMAVLFTAMNFGVWAAIFASLLSFGVYNFFFIPPLYTFTIAEPYELLALVIFLVVAVVSSAMAGRVREQARISASRMRAMRRLYEFTRRLSGLATQDAVAEGAASEMACRPWAARRRAAGAGPTILRSLPPGRRKTRLTQPR